MHKPHSPTILSTPSKPRRHAPPAAKLLLVGCAIASSLPATACGADRTVYVFIPTTPPLCPVDGDEAPIVAEGVEVGSPAWYAVHDELIAWATRVTVCREAQRAAREREIAAEAAARAVVNR